MGSYYKHMKQQDKDKLMEHSFSIKLRNGRIVKGARLSGRLHDYPRMQYQDRLTGMGIDVEVSWETAQNLANKDRALII